MFDKKTHSIMFLHNIVLIQQLYFFKYIYKSSFIVLSILGSLLTQYVYCLDCPIYPDISHFMIMNIRYLLAT